MSESRSEPWQQRLKSGRMWPLWLRNPRLLKWAFAIGVTAYRLARLWFSLTGKPDG